MPRKETTRFVPKWLFLKVLEKAQTALIFRPWITSEGYEIPPMLAPEEYGLQGFEAKTLPQNESLHIWEHWVEGVEGDAPVYLYCPGNTGHIGDCGPVLSDAGTPLDEAHKRKRFRVETLATLAETGASVVALSWPGFGNSKGEYSEETCRDAGAEVLNYVRERAGNDRRVVVYGESLGAAIMFQAIAQLTRQHKPFGGTLVTVGTFSTMAARAVDDYPRFSEAEIAARLRHNFNSVEAIAQCSACRVLLLHGKHDDVTLPRHSELLYAAAKRAGVEAELELMNAGHTDIKAADVVAILTRAGAV